jgi:hypothetical protein
MSNTCTICNSRFREQIELAIVRCEPCRRIAQEFEVSTSALQRHKGKHLSAAALISRDTLDRLHGNNLAQEVERYKGRLLKILDKADAKGNDDLVLKAAGEMRKYLELTGKLAGEFTQKPTITIPTPVVDEFTLAWLRGDIQDIESEPDPDDDEDGDKGKK